MIVQPGNDPQCRRAWDPRHLCIDAQGWPLTVDKRCYYETSSQMFEQSNPTKEAAK